MPDLTAIGVIPARYGSTRLEGKPLADICGKSMILRVAEQAMKSKRLSSVIVATDSHEIKNHLNDFGIKAVLTGKDIRTGTDRCYEAVKDMNCEIVVNIQGDEPLLDPEIVDKVVEGLAGAEEAVCCTAVIKIGAETAKDLNKVKVVTDKNGYALYFSRSTIPFGFRQEPVYFKHIGIYAYRKEFLKTFVNLESTMLEITESLEQLRMLENGYRIKCVEVKSDSLGVDTLEDLETVRKIIKEREN